MNLLSSPSQPLLLGGSDERQELSARALRACLAAEAALASLRAECIPLQSPLLWSAGEGATAKSNRKNLDLAQRSLQLQIDACESFALCATAAFKQLCDVYFSPLGTGIHDGELSEHNSSASVQKAPSMPTAESDNAWKKKSRGHRATSCSRRFSSPSPAGPSKAAAPSRSVRTLQIQDEAPNIIFSRDSLNLLMSTSGSDSEEAASNDDCNEDCKSSPPSPILPFRLPRPTVLTAIPSYIPVSTCTDTALRDRPSATETPQRTESHSSEINIETLDAANSANAGCSAESENDIPDPNPFATTTMPTASATQSEIPASFCSSQADDSTSAKFTVARPTPTLELRPAESSKSNGPLLESPHPISESPGSMPVLGLEGPPAAQCDHRGRTESSCGSSYPTHHAEGPEAASVTSTTDCNDLDPSAKGDHEPYMPGNALQVQNSGMEPELLGCVTQNPTRAFSSSTQPTTCNAPKIHNFFGQTNTSSWEKLDAPSSLGMVRAWSSEETLSESPPAREDLQFMTPGVRECCTKSSSMKSLCCQNASPVDHANQPERGSRDRDVLSYPGPSYFQERPSDHHLELGCHLQTRSLSYDKRDLQHVGDKKLLSFQPGMGMSQPDRNSRGADISFPSSTARPSTASCGKRSTSFNLQISHAATTDGINSGRKAGATASGSSLYETRHLKLHQQHQHQHARDTCYGGTERHRALPLTTFQMWSSYDSDASDFPRKPSTCISGSSSTGALPDTQHKPIQYKILQPLTSPSKTGSQSRSGSFASDKPFL